VNATPSGQPTHAELPSLSPEGRHLARGIPRASSPAGADRSPGGGELDGHGQSEAVADPVCLEESVEPVANPPADVLGLGAHHRRGPDGAAHQRSSADGTTCAKDTSRTLMLSKPWQSSRLTSSAGGRLGGGVAGTGDDIERANAVRFACRVQQRVDEPRRDATSEW
jgi:hypothetical protein